MKTATLSTAVLVATLLTSGKAQTNGVFADFSTSMGGFTCRLEHAKAPMATANFIGLVTGSRAWMETSTGRVRTLPFFTGVTFHRVISGFMIQGGSPNGLGTDGPGYVFPDEFDPSLRFDGTGVLAMANSGPRSNGAQFFITVAAAPWLNDVHTIFGKVVDGQTVVDAISQVTTDTNSKPVTNVVIQGISIRRVGAEAEAFNLNNQGLPVVTRSPLRLSIGNGQASLTFTNQAYADNYLCESTNLFSWTSTALGVDLAPPITNHVQRAIDVRSRFFWLSRVQYPSSTFTPRTLFNRSLTLAFDGGVGTLAIAFDAGGNGTYDYSGGGTGTVTSCSWYQAIYRGYLWPISYSGLVPMTLQLNFSSDTGGTFSGTVYTATPLAVTGSFALSTP